MYEALMYFYEDNLKEEFKKYDSYIWKNYDYWRQHIDMTLKKK